MFRTMMTASDLYYLGKSGGNRVMDIDLSSVLASNPKLTATAFNLSGDDQAALYKVGYLATKTFFLEQWNWKEHVQTRIASSTAAAAVAATGS